MLKKIGLFLFAGFSALVFFELFLRFSPYSLGISAAVYDKDLGFWHKKNFSSISKKKCYETQYYFDSDGLIKNDYIYDATKQDILILGDSYIEALMVKNPHIIHNALYRQYAGKYNFVNYGLSGTSMVQQFIILQSKAQAQLSHVHTVLQFIRIERDIDDVNPEASNGSIRPKVFLDFTDLEHFRVVAPKPYTIKEKIRDFLGNFELYVFVQKGLHLLRKKLRKNKQLVVKDVEIKDLEDNWLQVKGALWQTKRLLQKKGISYKIILYGKDVALTQTLTDFLQEKDFEYYDLLALAKQEKLSVSGFTCDKHWSDQTHLNVAKIIHHNHILD